MVSRTRVAVAIAAAALFAVWVGVHLDSLTGARDTLVRFALTTVFALLILLRPKAAAGAGERRGGLIGLAALAGMAGGIGGLVVGVRQAEWIGLLLLLGACLAWALPVRARGDVAKALFLLYWAHPLPSRILFAIERTMQQGSVTIAEKMLHTLNVRVWADGMILRTGLNIFEVPAWCSGMRTATTVFLLAIGLSVLKRLPWLHGVLAVAAALLQALLLNAARIAAMVLFLPRMPDATPPDYIHDSAGILVLGAVLLVSIEIEGLRRLKERRDQERSELNPATRKALRESPPFWQRVLDCKYALLAGVLAVALTALVVYRNRPSHRLAMYRGVVEALRDAGQLVDAERLGRHVARGTRDYEWNLVMLRILLLRGKYEDVLADLELLPPAAGPRDIERRILAAYSLMGLQRLDEARSIVAGLPEGVRNSDPRVAMILAEMACFGNDPEQVERYILTASRWGPNLSRVRTLFPYLRTHRRWEAIAGSDSSTPHRDPVQALSAAEALMNLDRTTAVATLAARAATDWPRDPRLLVPLFYLAGKRPDEGWEKRYGMHLLRCLPAIDDLDRLMELADRCFLLRRPDLAWILYRRIESLAPEHPYLSMLVVKHGSDWFLFRARFLGFAAASAWETRDIKAECLMAGMLPSTQALTETIPLADALCLADAVPYRKQALQKALRAFERMEPESMSVDMRYAYVSALEIDTQTDAAERVLLAIAADHPAEAEPARLFLSEIHERRGDWMQVYETLRGYTDAPAPRLDGLLRLAQAMLTLRLGPGAVLAGRKLREHYPRAPEAAGALAGALIQYDSPEAAWHVLSEAGPWRHRGLDFMIADALRRTQRYAAFRGFVKQAMLTSITLPDDTRQDYSLPAAELSTLWHLVFVPSVADQAAYAGRIRENLPRTASPFLEALYTRWLAAYADTEARDGVYDIAAWEACGRDRVEKATALLQLCLLACQRRHFASALAAAEAGTRHLPESGLLWRFRIGLSHADPAVIAAARAAVPDDSEVWLAELSRRCLPRFRSEGGDAQSDNASLRADVLEAAASGRFPPAMLARAAELLLRAGYTRTAAACMREAVPRANTLLPVLILGLRCAMAEGDRTWALDCTRLAIEAALDPPPAFYRKLVEIKTEGTRIAADDAMVEALKKLRRSDPDNPLWARMLAFVRFQRGGWEIVDALHQADAALLSGGKDRLSYGLAAEAARLLQNPERAVDVLRQGLETHPHDAQLLNNLVYTLAQSPATAPDALAYIPELLAMADRPAWMIDTVAYVYIRNGRLRDGERALAWMESCLEPGSRSEFRYRLRRAEIAFARQAYADAEAILKDILARSRGIPDEDILTANRLLSRADEALRADQATTP